jgi:hypothetical protein
MSVARFTVAQASWLWGERASSLFLLYQFQAFHQTGRMKTPFLVPVGLIVTAFAASTVAAPRQIKFARSPI